jgi:Tol biopolymer transport system component
MYLHRWQNLIGRPGGGLPRRRLLQGAGAFGIAATLRPTAVFAERDDEDERLGPFGPWSTPVNLGPMVNSPFHEWATAISKDGLSLYITSSRPGGVNGPNLGQRNEIWVSQRASIDAPWQAPVNLDAYNTRPVINLHSATSGNSNPNLSPDGHLLFFQSPRPGGYGDADLYVSRRTNKHDDFGWQEPVNLGGLINTRYEESTPDYFEDEETGIIVLYFSSNRPGGPPGSLSGTEHQYVSTLGDDGTFGPGVLVPELSSPYNDIHAMIRRDGLELFLNSDRPNGRIGTADIWVSTRDSTRDPWSPPVNLGPTVNYPGYRTARPALSWDGTTLYFNSNRPGGFNAPADLFGDIYVTTRRNLRERERDDESGRQRQ